MNRKSNLQRAGAAVTLALLAGCGGGDNGISSTPTPPAAATPPPPPVTQPTPVTPAPVTTPPPPPVAPTINFDDAEYRRSNAATAANALTAYSRGATGRGVKIAIVDSGITDTLGEFTGRIDAASRDLVGSRGLGDESGHGTSVAAVAAAGRNGAQIEGLAFDSTLLVLRTDTPGSCAATDGCSHSTNDMARAVDVATQNGARVINMSLGGSAAPTTLRNAIARATAAGVIVVISAGNDGAADPDPLSLVANSNPNNLVVIAGAHDGAFQIASFSNRAGTGQAHYLTALGSRVRAFDQTGGAFLFSGTSYAAPTITGAAALLASAFPNLSGAQIVDLLFSSATDAGAAGTDAVYGRGILNIAAAFQPRGAMTVVGTSVAVSPADTTVLGTAMGDASTRGATAGAIVLDGYSRAYAMDLIGSLRRAGAARPLARAFAGNVRSTSAGAGPLALSLTTAPAGPQARWVGLEPLNLNRATGARARALAGAAVARIGPRTALAMGFAEDGATLARKITGMASGPYLVARGPGETLGIDARRGLATALRHDLGRVALSMTGEQGTLPNYRLRRGGRLPDYRLGRVGLDGRIGALTLGGGLGLLDERGSVLGSQLGSAFGNAAQTRLADATATLDLGDWVLGAEGRIGWTRADAGVATAGRGRFRSTAFAIDATRSGAFVAGDSLGLRIAQPFRVANGGYRLSVPVDYDYSTGAIGYAARTLDLAPDGREIDVEAGYGVALGAGWLTTNLYWRRDPGNIAALPDDRGLAVRFATGW